MTWRQLLPRDVPAWQAVQHSAAVFGRDDLVAVVVYGKHHRRFLHVLTTAAIEQAPVGGVVPAALTDAHGAIFASFWAHIGADGCTLWVERRAAEPLIARLASHRVSERVAFAIDEDRALVELHGPAAERVADAAADSASLAWQIWPQLPPPALAPTWPWGPPPPVVRATLARSALEGAVPALLGAGAAMGCLAVGEALRIAAGEGRIATEVHEACTPWELGLATSVSLSKGCYLGQEALAMQAWRGQMRRQLCWIAPDDGPPPPQGATLRAGGRKAGVVGSGVIDPAGVALGLAVLARRVCEPDTTVDWHPDADAATPAGGRVRVVGVCRPAPEGP